MDHCSSFAISPFGYWIGWQNIMAKPLRSSNDTLASWIKNTVISRNSAFIYHVLSPITISKYNWVQSNFGQNVPCILSFNHKFYLCHSINVFVNAAHRQELFSYNKNYIKKCTYMNLIVSTWVHPLFLVVGMFAHPFRFLCCVFAFWFSWMPNIASVSGFTIFDCPFSSS